MEVGLAVVDTVEMLKFSILIPKYILIPKSCFNLVIMFDNCHS